MKSSKTVVMLHKVALVVYKTVGAIFLYAVLALVLSYPLLLGFYALNNSWCAPTIFTASEDKILALTQQVITSHETLGTLTLTLNQSKNNLATMIQEEGDLRRLRQQLDSEIPKETKENRERRNTLLSLEANKKMNNNQSELLAEQTDNLRASVAQDLTAGLITQNDAVSLLESINQIRVEATNSKIEEVTLEDAVSQKSSEHTSWLAVLTQRAALSTQIDQLVDGERTAREQIATNMQEIAELNTTIAKAEETPYYRASQSKHTVFAFVPSDNQRAAQVGTLVFDCYLSMVVCRRAGTVVRVFGDEEQAINPVLKTPTRGFLIELNLTDENFGRSKTLMLGSKPFLF